MSNLISKANVLKIADISYRHGLKSGFNFLRDNFSTDQQALILDPVNKDTFNEVIEKIINSASKHYIKELEEMICKEAKDET